MIINESLKRAFFEENDELHKLNADPKRCGKFNKMKNDIFHKWIGPFAKYYRKSKIYDNYELIIEYKYSPFSSFIGITIEVKDQNMSFEPIYIPKKSKDCDIDEYAYACISNIVNKLEEQ